MFGPTGWTLFSTPVDWNAFAGNTWFTDLPEDVLGFEYFFEFGAAIEMQLTELPVSALRLSGSYITGDEITGYTLGFSVKF